jgi:hypothetical protein
MTKDMRALYLVCLTFAALGCAPSEEEIKQDWKAFLDRHQACKQDSDCTLISAGCPLGCASPIAVDAVADGERVAKELIEDYESGGRSCAYECVAGCVAACEESRCVVAAASQETSSFCPR